MKYKIILLPLISLLAAGSLTAKPDKGQGQGQRPEPPTPEQMLERFDKDGSGALELEELQVASEMRNEKREEMKEKMKERQGNGKGRTERVTMIFEKFDVDGDGNLSVEEFEEFITTMQERRPGPAKGPRVEE